MGILKSLFGSSIEKSFVSDAQKVLSVCRTYGPLERANLKVCTTMALAFLVADIENDKDQSFHFIADAMWNNKPLSEVQIGLASSFNLRLIGLQQEANRSTSPINNRIASGIAVWIVSIRALMYVAVLPYARELWAILQDGDALTVYDELERLTQQLGEHPVGVQLAQRRHLSTPPLFTPC